MDASVVEPSASVPSSGLALGLLSLGHAVIHAQSALMPLIYPIIIVEFALNERDIGLFIAITTAIGGAMQLLYGFITRYVPRPTLLAGGQLVFGGALMLGGLAQSVGQLLASISVARIGASPQHPVGNALLSDAFPEHRRGFAISAHIAGGNVGTILVPFVGAYLILQLGWHWTLALFGIPALIVGVLIALRIREDRSAERDAARRSGSVWGQLRDVLGRRDIRLIMGAALIAAGGRGLDIVAPFMLLYFSQELGLDASTTALLYALLLVGAVVGPLLAGWLSDRFGRRPTLVTYWLLSAVGILLFSAAGSNMALLVPLLLPFGTAVFSESPVLQAYLADRASGPIRDVAFSVYFTAAFGIGAFWAVVIGTIIAEFGYPVAFSVMAASYLAAAALLILIRER
jgi:MFS transporter, FSR family, fosmidomycin resistance protein